MRAIFLVLILAVVGLIALFATGFLDINQTREAAVPRIEAGNGTIRAEPGQAPSFDVETGSVAVGTREANVPVPKVEVKRDQATVEVPTVEVRRAEDAQQNAAR